MRFLLSFLFVFLSIFAKAQVPPMAIGGPQGIDVTRILARNWMNVPIYVDTPATPLTGSGWPGRGYLITVVKNETPCQNCPPKDTSLWIYTGNRWKRVGMDYVTRLVYGGQVSKASGSNRNYIIQPYGAFFDGDYRSSLTNKTATLAPKTINNTGRIDVLVLNRDSFLVKTGVPNKIPQKPTVAGSEIEVASFYFESFDSIPTMINTSSKVTNIYRVEGIDSIYFNIDTLTFAIRDSIGISKNDTAAMLNPYKFTAANGLTKDSTVFRLGGSLNQSTDINLNTRRLTIIGGSDTTRFFPNGRVSVGGAPDSTNMLNVNGNTRVNGFLRLAATSPTNASVIVNQNSNDGSLAWVSNATTLPSNFGARNVIISPSGTYSSLTGAENVLIGRLTGQSLTSGLRNTFVGNNAGSSITTGVNNIFIGGSDGWGNVPSNTSNSIQIVGGLHESNKADTILLGLTSSYAFIGGGSSGGTYIRDYYFGGGHRVRSPHLSNINFFAPSGYPTAIDTIGSDFTINAGRGTGTGVGGSVIFRTSPATTSGTTLQTLTERARISHRGNLLVGTATDDTSSLVNIVSTTKGFLQPRMTNTQRDAITTPATGLQLFSNTDSANYVYRGTGGGWQKIANEISASATLDFPSTNNGNKSDLTINGITGAEEGDVVALGIQNSVNLNHSCFTAWVSAANTVTVRFSNYGTGALDPVSATFKVKVFK